MAGPVRVSPLPRVPAQLLLALALAPALVAVPHLPPPGLPARLATLSLHPHPRLLRAVRVEVAVVVVVGVGVLLQRTLSLHQYKQQVLPLVEELSRRLQRLQQQGRRLRVVDLAAKHHDRIE